MVLILQLKKLLTGGSGWKQYQISCLEETLFLAKQQGKERHGKLYCKQKGPERKEEQLAHVQSSPRAKISQRWGGPLHAGEGTSASRTHK